MNKVVAFFADRLLNPETGAYVEKPVVVVEDGRVRSSGRRETVSVPTDAEKVDATGLTLLPGLIDCHVHLCSPGTGIDFAERVMTPPSVGLLRAVVSCRKTLDAGFTTVRDAGGAPNGLRIAVERGYFPGPRMLLAIQILSQTGGHADNHFPCGVSFSGIGLLAEGGELPPSVVDGVENMRLRVRELIRAGADWIKLCTSGGVLSPQDSPHHAAFTIDEIRAAVEEAAAQGRRVMSHAQAAAGIRNALKAGVFTIEHGIWIEDDIVELMLRGGNVLVPSLVAPQWVIRHAENGRMPAYAATKGRQVVADHSASIRKAIEAGVVVAFGTDTGVGPHGSMGEEFLFLNRLGMQPIDCIRSATTVAAKALSIDKTAGHVGEGAWGDIIGVPGDPLGNLELLAKPENVHLVVKGGEVVKSTNAVAAAV